MAKVRKIRSLQEPRMHKNEGYCDIGFRKVTARDKRSEDVKKIKENRIYKIKP